MSIHLLAMGQMKKAAAGGGGSIEYVGGQTYSAPGGTTALTADLTTLTGGLASAPAENDLVIVTAVHVAENTAPSDPAMNTAGYTEETDIVGTDFYRVRMAVYRKFMGGTPDTSFEIANTGNTAWPVAVAVHVWRGVNQTTPMDVTTVTATGANSPLCNPAAITPTTSGSVVVVSGACSSDNSGVVFTSPDLSNFRSVSAQDTRDATVGMGSFAWTSGAFDPGQWSGGSTSGGTNTAWVAATMALRPA